MFKRLIVSVILILLVFVVDIFSGGALRGAVGRAVSFVYGAAVHTETQIAESGVLRTKASLARENAELRNEVARLLEHGAAYEALKVENASLSQFVHLAQTKPGITAPIISSTRSSPYGTFAIGAGTKSGVSVGDIVLSADSFVLGRVSQAYGTSAIVLETFAPNSKIDLVVSGVIGQSTGDGAGNAHVDIPRSSLIKIGDSVSAPSFGGAVGVVGSIASSTASATERLFIRVPVNLDVLQFVYVVSSK